MIKVEYLNLLSPERKKRLMARSMVEFQDTLEITKNILANLKKDPVKELQREYGSLKANIELKDFKVQASEIEAAFESIPKDTIEALKKASQNIEKFHKAQLERPMWLTEISHGLIAGRMTRPLEKVGVYIPGGRAVYPSSALMNIIPAKVAGVKDIIAVSPPDEHFNLKPSILVAAHLAGATEIYKLGGAWAVGSLAYGLGGLPRVDKIVGPGSSWVTAAKMAVYGEVDIDSPAGPSEGFIIADDSAPPQWLAWDLLSQLEHDPQAAAILVTTDIALAEQVVKIVKQLLVGIERAEIINSSLKNSAAILVADNLEQAFDLSNEYAPEHLQIILKDPMAYLGKITNAGSVFLGPYSPIPAGDYASGPNHVLPTGGAARMFSGLSTDTFLKKITFQQLNSQALKELTPTVSNLARAEGLYAHARAMEIRNEKN